MLPISTSTQLYSRPNKLDPHFSANYLCPTSSLAQNDTMNVVFNHVDIKTNPDTNEISAWIAVDHPYDTHIQCAAIIPYRYINAFDFHKGQKSAEIKTGIERYIEQNTRLWQKKFATIEVETAPGVIQKVPEPYIMMYPISAAAVIFAASYLLYNQSYGVIMLQTAN